MCQRLRFLSVAVFVLGGFGLRPVGAYDASLCGWWPLNDGSGTVAVDASGKAVNGTLFGDPVWSRDGKNGGCLTFDGVNDYVFIDGKFALPNYTIAVWFRDDSPGQRDIVSCYATGVRHGILLEVGSDNRLRFLHRFPLGTGGGNNIYTPFTPNGTWHHVAATKSPTDIALYIDGKEVGRLPDASVFGAADAFGIALGCLDNERGNARMFLGAMDDLQIYYRALSAAEIPGTMVGLVDKALAMNPSPAHDATDVPRDATLSWTPGQYAGTHDVYLGTTLADVNSATRATTKGVLVSENQADTMFDPPEAFAFGQTYYWRIDEVNQSVDHTIFKGGVWSFTVEPYAYPVQPVAATASSSQPGMGPENTINGSGLTDGQHGTLSTTMWLSSGVLPQWIQYEFDAVYKLSDLTVWNSNQAIESILGFGAKTVQIELSTDGATWTAVTDVPEFAWAAGAPGYTADTTVNLGGALAKYVKLTILSNWGGLSPQGGLSEVQFSHVPVRAREPQPSVGAAGVDPRSVLSWRPGREAGKHRVYLSDDVNEVRDGRTLLGTVPTSRFDAAGVLQLGRTYYWRVDEVNDAGPMAAWEGEIWSFSTAASLPVDDMESYNDAEGMNTRIYEVWIDGWGTTTNGSQVGHDGAPFAERTTVRGGVQSMPFRYGNNGAAYSEATRTFDEPQDWTQYGVKGLILWFVGDSANTAGQLYVKVNGKKVIYDGDAENLLRKPWQMWYVDLGSLTGVNLKKVTELTIGVEGGAGILFIDDIGLSPLARQVVTPVQPATTGLVLQYKFEGDVKSSQGTLHGTTAGAPAYVAGKVGQAIRLNGVGDYVTVEGSFNLPEYSAALWFQVEGGSGQRAILAVYQPTGALYGLLLEVGTDGRLRYLHRAPVAAQGGTDLYGSLNYGDGAWYHVGVVKSVQSMTIYVNGMPAATAANATPFDQALQKLALGVLRSEEPSRYFPGAMDEFHLYSRVLSDAEMASLAGRIKPFDKP